MLKTYIAIRCPDANNGNAYLDCGRFKDMSVPAHTNIRVASHFVRSIDFGDMIDSSKI